MISLIGATATAIILGCIAYLLAVQTTYWLIIDAIFRGDNSTTPERQVSFMLAMIWPAFLILAPIIGGIANAVNAVRSRS